MNTDLTKLPVFLDSPQAPAGHHARLSAGDFFLHQGAEVEHFALLKSGCLRVYTSGEAGREITLYKVAPGECCLLNVLCLVSGQTSPAFGVAETDLEAQVYSRATFLEWLDSSAEMRRFVFGIMATRVTGMMELINEVTFKRLDCRLAAYLLQRCEGAGFLAATHDAVAADLGTAREVISRLLKGFEDQGLVRLSRGRIAVEDAVGLADMGC